MLRKGLSKNLTALKLVKKKANEVYINQSVDALKAKLDNMKKKCEEFKIKINPRDTINQVQDQCAKLRNQVHLRTDTLIKQVHQIDESIIAEIDENEKECVQSFNDKAGV
jgi:SMC interacting uncharacterized protein involved in chromosome segregation